ncbi:MAG: hypothetical protein K8T89_14850 [Planctomycetes bacterium]|nr:hypothetical protein [Planctomycetota bacterium]
MAEKSFRLIRDALSRAASEPAGFALLASKTEPGLFPPTSPAKAAAEHCKNEGFLHVLRTETKGKLTREICALTDKGRHYLVREANPSDVLEDFIRVLESRHADVETLAQNVQQMQESLLGIRSAVEQILPRLASHSVGTNGKTHNGVFMNGTAALLESPTTTTTETLIAEVKAKLAEWHESAGASEDCPLPELHRRLETAERTSIGQFHDVLRQLHEDRMIYLHPWTGPLYALPEPALALLVGHEIAYYASIR